MKCPREGVLFFYKEIGMQMESCAENDTRNNDLPNEGKNGSLLLGEFFEQARRAFGLDPTEGKPKDASWQ